MSSHINTYIFISTVPPGVWESASFLQLFLPSHELLGNSSYVTHWRRKEAIQDCANSFFKFSVDTRGER